MLETLGYILLFLFMLFAPGFLLALVFYPKPGSLDFWERVAVSLGLGVLIIIYIGVVLARPDWKLLSLAPFTGAVLVVCGFCAVAAYLRGGMAIPAAYVRTVMHAIRKPKPQEQPAQEQVQEQK